MSAIRVELGFADADDGAYKLKLFIEFTSPDSGAYIHEMTNELEHNETLDAPVLEILLTYPDGDELYLESITLKEDTA